MSVPNTNTFSFQDVSTEIYSDTAVGRNLYQSFIDAYGTFDPNYVGSKNNLLNFRDYNNIIYDYDGNGYNAVKIGNQIWLATNFRCLHLNDGTAIKNDSIGLNGVYSIHTETVPALVDFTRDLSNNVVNPTYGCGYNAYAVRMKTFPIIGWHVATSNDYNTLSITLGGAALSGGHLKQIGTTTWTSPNTGADNSSKFNALGLGRINYSGNYYNKGYNAWFWTSTDNVGGDFGTGGDLNSIQLDYNDSALYSLLLANNDTSMVRLIKNTWATVQTNSPSFISYFSAQLNGTVQDTGYYSVTERGFCYGTSANPTISGTHIVNSGVGLGTYNNTPSTLNPSTTYHIRAYAVTSDSIQYGSDVTMNTLSTMLVSTNTCRYTYPYYVLSGSSTIYTGTVTSFGFCYSNTNSNPTISNGVINGVGTYSSFSANLYNLIPGGTSVYVRAFVTSQYETIYGVVTFIHQ